MTSARDRWRSANGYDSFMGRWSRLVADDFVDWLDPRPNLRWLDLGCGTGALTSAILELANPASILACDPSEPLIRLARRHIPDRRVTFEAGSANNLPRSPYELNAFVSGLVLNFIPDPKGAVESIARILTPSAIVGAYVWDYLEGMGFLRVFWDVVTSLDASAVDLDEGKRFPICAPDPLRSLFESAGLKNVEVCSLEITTKFESFADYWEPFLGGTGPAPTYVNSLPREDRQQLEEKLRARLSSDGSGGFDMAARAWAVRGST